MQRMKDLVGLISQLDHEYYNLDSPTISDYEYDRLYAELVQLEKDHPEEVLPYSPTSRVPGKCDPRFKMIKHIQPMYSLDKVHSEAELMDWYKSVEDELRGK